MQPKHHHHYHHLGLQKSSDESGALTINKDLFYPSDEVSAETEYWLWHRFRDNGDGVSDGGVTRLL